MTQKEKELYKLLLPQYGVNLDIESASQVMKKSPSTLYRMRIKKIGPGFIKEEENGDNSAVLYPLHEIIRYLCDTQDTQEASNEKPQ